MSDLRRVDDGDPFNAGWNAALDAVATAEAMRAWCICGRGVLRENWANHLRRQDGRHGPLWLMTEDIADALRAESGSIGLDVERLARALARVAEVGPPAHINPDAAEEHWPSYRMEAEEYAREYAALSREEATSE